MRLEIYVASDCDNCEEALRIAELAREVDGIDVAVIDLDEADQTVPLRVVAVPTYLLDGRIVSLGNPYRDEFLTQLRARGEEVAT
jgi:glutaredoxin